MTVHDTWMALTPSQRRIITVHNDLASLASNGWDMIRLEDLPRQIESMRYALESVAIDMDIEEFLVWTEDEEEDDDEL